MSALIAMPLLLTLILGLGGVFYILKHKSLTQAICVQSASRLQQELRRNLQQILKMNHEAKRLQRQRQAAEQALNLAIQLKNPPAIATAQAAKTAIALAQGHLRAQQMNILKAAENQRAESERQWRAQMVHLQSHNLKIKRTFPLPLAVHPSPLVSDSPEYLPVLRFAYFQQQEFSYETEIKPPFLERLTGVASVRQQAQCAATLFEREGKWHIDLRAANAPSRPW